MVALAKRVDARVFKHLKRQRPCFAFLSSGDLNAPRNQEKQRQLLGRQSGDDIYRRFVILLTLFRPDAGLPMRYTKFCRGGPDRTADPGLLPRPLHRRRLVRSPSPAPLPRAA
jgi:hypothetical protein